MVRLIEFAPQPQTRVRTSSAVALTATNTAAPRRTRLFRQKWKSKYLDLTSLIYKSLLVPMNSFTLKVWYVKEILRNT